MRNLKIKQRRYNKARESERVDIKLHQIQKRFNIKPVKEGKEWVIRDNEIELRNSSKQGVLKDLATIRGYNVSGKSKPNRTTDKI